MQSRLTPTPYHVARANTTPDEPLPGFYWQDDDGDIHGPYWTVKEARDAIYGERGDPCAHATLRYADSRVHCDRCGGSWQD